jgi:hypothetical protein
MGDRRGACRVGNVGGTGEVHAEFWWGDLRERVHLEDQGVNRRVILKCIFKKWDMEAMTGMFWLRLGTGGGCFECGNEPPGSIKRREFVILLETVRFSGRTLLHEIL